MNVISQVPHDLKQCAYKWFEGKVPDIWEAKNVLEKHKRLQWLAEGSLAYHLSRFTTPLPPVQSELDLFAEFMASNPPRLAKRRKKQ